MATQLLSAVPERLLAERVTSLSDAADPITRATDMLIQGV